MTTALLVHGALSDSRMWAPHIALLGTRGIAARAPALAGFHPDPFAAESFSSERHLAALGGALTAAAEPVHLIGHSRGGRLALALAASHPERIASLMLIEPGGAAEPDFCPQRSVRPIHDAITRGEACLAARLYLDAGHGAGTWRSLPAGFRAIAADNASTLFGTLADRTVALSRRTASRIACPTLLVEGASSPAIFHATHDVLEATIADVGRRRIADQDHFYPVRAPDHLAVVIGDWIASHCRDSAERWS